MAGNDGHRIERESRQWSGSPLPPSPRYGPAGLEADGRRCEPCRACEAPPGAARRPARIASGWHRPAPGGTGERTRPLGAGGRQTGAATGSMRPPDPGRRALAARAVQVPQPPTGRSPVTGRDRWSTARSSSHRSPREPSRRASGARRSAPSRRRAARISRCMSVPSSPSLGSVRGRKASTQTSAPSRAPSRGQRGPALLRPSFAGVCAAAAGLPLATDPGGSGATLARPRVGRSTRPRPVA